MALNSIANDSERRMFAEAFNGFTAAWKTGFSQVERYGCFIVPDEYKSVVMSFDTPLSFCTANEKDESLCLLSLMQHLADRHNEIIESAIRSQTRAYKADQLNRFV